MEGWWKMKITNWGILLVVLLLPLFVMNNINVAQQKFSLHTEEQYNAAIDTAVRDAARALMFNEKQQFEAGYGSVKKYRANKEEAVQTFFHTLYLNFNVEDDPYVQGTLQRYIPVMAVIDYDGYWIYAPEEYSGTGGYTELKHVWKPKQPFAYKDASGNSLAFTLDDTVTAYDKAKNRWERGRRAAVASRVSIPLLNNADTFDSVRRTTIIQSLQKDLEFYINSYNAYSKQYGIAYTFTLPTISDEEWNNTVDDIGFLAFVQGMPLGDKAYNKYALGGARIVKKPAIYGTVVNGIPYYYSSTCKFSYTPKETFGSEKEAAEHGYYPLRCANQP
jgi:hypothetical protein